MTIDCDEILRLVPYSKIHHHMIEHDWKWSDLIPYVRKSKDLYIPTELQLRRLLSDILHDILDINPSLHTLGRSNPRHKQIASVGFIVDVSNDDIMIGFCTYQSWQKSDDVALLTSDDYLFRIEVSLGKFMKN